MRYKYFYFIVTFDLCLIITNYLNDYTISKQKPIILNRINYQCIVREKLFTIKTVSQHSLQNNDNSIQLPIT